MTTPAPSDPTPKRRSAVRDGFVGGLLGGVAVMILFFVVDLAQGDVLRTPSFLASAVFDPVPEAVGILHIVGFTVVHLGIFSAVGAVGAWLFRLARAPENFLLGGIFGLFAYTFLFYGALSLADVAVMDAPEWPGVLLGNFLAGVVLGGYLHWVGPHPGIVGLAQLVRDYSILREGIVAGLAGAAVLALWFLVVDVVLREAFHTPGALGSLLFLGARGPDAVVISAGTVLGYTVVHLAAFIILGVVVSGIATWLENDSGFLGAVVILFAISAVVFMGFVTFLGVWILEAMAIWAVLVGNLLAAVAMGGYLWRAHPSLTAEIRAGTLGRDI